MTDHYGSDFITISDEDGQEFELEVLTELEYNGFTYLAVIPAGLEEGEASYYPHIWKSIYHKIRSESHHLEEAACKEIQAYADDQSRKEVEKKRNTYCLDYLVPSFGSYVLGAQDGCSEGNDLKKKEYQIHELVDHSDSSNAVVGMTAQHECIDCTKHHHQQGLDEDRSCKSSELPA